MYAGCAGKTLISLENACHTWAPESCYHKALYKSTFTFTFTYSFTVWSHWRTQFIHIRPTDWPHPPLHLSPTHLLCIPAGRVSGSDGCRKCTTPSQTDGSNGVVDWPEYTHRLLRRWVSDRVQVALLHSVLHTSEPQLCMSCSVLQSYSSCCSVC